MLLLVCVTAQASAAEWTKVKREDAGFSVSMPGKPTIAKEPDGEKLSFETADKSSLYMAMWSKLPRKIDIKNKDVQKSFFDEVQKGVLSNIKDAKILETEDEDIEEEPGRYLSIEAPGGKFINYMIVCDGEFAYQLMVLGSKDFVDGDDAEKFADSFEFLEE